MKDKKKKSPPVAAGGSPSSGSLGSDGYLLDNLSRTDYITDLTDCEDITGVLNGIENPIIEELNRELEEKFTDKKKGSLKLAGVYDALGLVPRAGRVSECASFLEFALSSDGAKLHHANFCRDRFCPQCNWRRSLKIFGQVSACMDYLTPAGYRYLFLTLTIKNCSADDFPDTVQRLFDGWRIMQHKNKKFRKAVLGTFRSLEVTYNIKTETFHPHFHVILAVPPAYFSKKSGLYITNEEWSKMWGKSCGLDYDPIIFIQNVLQRVDKKTGQEQSIAGAVSEVAKYSVKSSDYLTDNLEENKRILSAYLSGLSGRRLCSFTGCFAQARKALALDDAENGDLVHTDSESMREDIQTVIVRFHWSSGAYFVGSISRKDDSLCPL